MDFVKEDMPLLADAVQTAFEGASAIVARLETVNDPEVVAKARVLLQYWTVRRDRFGSMHLRMVAAGL